MSYTALDGYHDTLVEGETLRQQVERLRESSYALIRKSDWDAFMRLAQAYGYDYKDPASHLQGALANDLFLATANWHKERKEWEPER